MKNLVTLMMVFCCSISLGMAQLNPMSSVGYATEAPPGYCLSVEEYFVHSEDAGELAGLTTYRVYLNCVNETDFLSACGGEDKEAGSREAIELSTCEAVRRIARK